MRKIPWKEIFVGNTYRINEEAVDRVLGGNVLDAVGATNGNVRQLAR